jgi:hypothetical protein
MLHVPVAVGTLPSRGETPGTPELNREVPLDAKNASAVSDLRAPAVTCYRD